MDRLRIRNGKKKPDCWAKASVYNRLAFVAPPGRVQAKERHHHHPPPHTEEPRYYNNTEMWHSQFHLETWGETDSRNQETRQQCRENNQKLFCCVYVSSGLRKWAPLRRRSRNLFLSIFKWIKRKLLPRRDNRTAVATTITRKYNITTSSSSSCTTTHLILGQWTKFKSSSIYYITLKCGKNVRL